MKPLSFGNIQHQPVKSRRSMWKTITNTIFVICCVLVSLLFLSARTNYKPLSHETSSGTIYNAPPPKPESIDVFELPLPPVAPSREAGSCSVEINPHRTGCMGKEGTFQSGSFTPDGNHVTATIDFVGAPNPPDSASIYSGEQVIIIKINGTFSNGDTWKCVTCGLPSKGNAAVVDFGYVQAFKDGKRLLIGSNILQCDHNLLSDECTPDNSRIVPIFWDNGSSEPNGGPMRELRLHPDQEHIAWSSFVFDPPNIGQFGFVGRLQLHSTNESHLQYTLTSVWLLVDAHGKSSLYAEGNEIKQNANAIVIGEIRGFSGSGREITYLGVPVESGNADVFAVNLITGKVRRLTSHPEYVDPVDISPDDNWTVVMDTRGSNRQMFLSAMRGIPPITDMITFAAVCSVRNNGQRRFFQPYLIDRYGDRGSYTGQKINEEGSGVPGSGAINDPEWNGSADPKWSPYGNRIVYSQRLTVSPACGGKNPLPCYGSTAEGERTARIMLATLTDRPPYEPLPVMPFADVVPWAVRYVPGHKLPTYSRIAPGKYFLRGQRSGEAYITVETNFIAASYHKYSDDGLTFIDGDEEVTSQPGRPRSNVIDWHSNLVQSGATQGTKKTSAGGFQLSINVFENIFEANGTLITTVDGVSHYQPANRT